MDAADQRFHAWYRFVLSFPPHLVRQYIESFGLQPGSVLLDPFAGTGTTLVEAKLNGIKAIGIEAVPFLHFASSVKLDWTVDPDLLMKHSQKAARATLETLTLQGIDDTRPYHGQLDNLALRSLEPEAAGLLIKDSVSPLPMHKTLVLLDSLMPYNTEPHFNHMLLALATALVTLISNLRFGPEVGIGKPKLDAPVVASWLSLVNRIATDLRTVAGRSFPPATVFRGDARDPDLWLAPGSVDAVITSPPYPNEKDYSRTIRLESVVLGLMTSRHKISNL